MFKSKKPLVKLKEIFLENENTPPQPLFSTIVIHFIALLSLPIIIGIILGIASVWLNVSTADLNEAMNGSWTSIDLLSLFFGGYFPVKYFYKKYGRVLNKKEYKKLLSIILPINFILGVISGILTWKFSDNPLMMQLSVQKLLIFSVIGGFVWILLVKLCINLNIVRIYNKNKK